MLKGSVLEAADLAAMLPRGSRTFTAIDPEYAWEQSHYLLANIANSLALLVWAKTKDAEKGRNRPKMIKPPSRADQGKVTYSTEEYKRLLSRPRREVR